MNPDIWSFIFEHLSENVNVILMIVTDVQGSSPGKIGFKMAVAETGELSGSIGGGVMEYNLVEQAREMLITKKSDIFFRRQVHLPDTIEDKSGMICAGEQTQVYIPLSKDDLGNISRIIDCINKGEKGILEVTSQSWSFSKTDFRLKPQPADGKEKYTEIIGLADTVYIFGAGHISLPLSQILRMLNFRVVVYDDRDNLSTFMANNYAHIKKVIDYDDAASYVEEGANSYAAIMSFGHKADKLILGQLLSKKLRYLGMIGSRSKTGTIYESLRPEGFNDNDFKRVCSPIGISIGSQTPAEIAVSIAAQIIQVRNSK